MGASQQHLMHRVAKQDRRGMDRGGSGWGSRIGGLRKMRKIARKRRKKTGN